MSAEELDQQLQTVILDLYWQVEVAALSTAMDGLLATVQHFQHRSPCNLEYNAVVDSIARFRGMPMDGAVRCSYTTPDCD
jgi:hypothetical protein